jgi:hypothetical protein
MAQWRITLARAKRAPPYELIARADASQYASFSTLTLPPVLL